MKDNMKKYLSETGWKGKEQSPLPQDSAHFGGVFFSTVMKIQVPRKEGISLLPELTTNFSRTNLHHDVTHNIFILLSHRSFQQLFHTEPSVVGCWMCINECVLTWQTHTKKKKKRERERERRNLQYNNQFTDSVLSIPNTDKYQEKIIESLMLRYGYNVSVSTISTRKSDMRYLFCFLRLKITGSSHFLPSYVCL